MDLHTGACFHTCFHLFPESVHKGPTQFCVASTGNLHEGPLFPTCFQMFPPRVPRAGPHVSSCFRTRRAGIPCGRYNESAPATPCFRLVSTRFWHAGHANTHTGLLLPCVSAARGLAFLAIVQEILITGTCFRLGPACFRHAGHAALAPVHWPPHGESTHVVSSILETPESMQKKKDALFCSKCCCCTSKRHL